MSVFITIKHAPIIIRVFGTRRRAVAIYNNIIVLDPCEWKLFLYIQSSGPSDQRSWVVGVELTCWTPTHRHQVGNQIFDFDTHINN